jgi:CO/xanthine dehydrogenase FAD-binding subunit
MSKQMKLNKNKKILKINAAATLDEIYINPDCPKILKNALEMNSWHERNEYTLGDSLLSTALNPHWVSVLLALEARLETNDSNDEKLLKYIHKKSKKEKVKSLSIPIEVPGRRLGEAHVGMTPADKPIVSAIAAVAVVDGKVQQAKLALTGVWEENVGLAKSVDQLKGEQLKDKIIEKVSEDIEKEVKPRGDYRGSIAYRKAMAGVLAKRALEMCK